MFLIRFKYTNLVKKNSKAYKATICFPYSHIGRDYFIFVGVSIRVGFSLLALYEEFKDLVCGGRSQSAPSFVQYSTLIKMFFLCNLKVAC